MSKVIIDGDTQDTLFAIFTLAQDLERRVVRMIARGHFNVHAVNEMVSQVAGISNEIQAIAEIAQGMETRQGEDANAASGEA